MSFGLGSPRGFIDDPASSNRLCRPIGVTGAIRHRDDFAQAWLDQATIFTLNAPYPYRNS
jgi:hypothetical protein